MPVAPLLSTIKPEESSDIVVLPGEEIIILADFGLGDDHIHFAYNVISASFGEKQLGMSPYSLSGNDDSNSRVLCLNHFDLFGLQVK